MTIERADLSVSLSLEQTAPVSGAPVVQEQASPEGGEGKPRRRPPPEEAAAEPAEEDRDQPPHRIDSLA
ncbi:MAG: hypothetical protein WCA76_05215 [Candidatus Sulfotelmatobacter sp.]|jgi:hypothetical protein